MPKKRKLTQKDKENNPMGTDDPNTTGNPIRNEGNGNPVKRLGLLINFGYACHTKDFITQAILADPTFLSRILNDDGHKSQTVSLFLQF